MYAPKIHAAKFQLGLNSGFGVESGFAAAGFALLSAVTTGDLEPNETVCAAAVDNVAAEASTRVMVR